MRVVAAVVGATTTAASMCETCPAWRTCERWPRRRKGLSGSGRTGSPYQGSWDRLGLGGLLPGDLAVWDGHVAMVVGNGMVSKRVINGGQQAPQRNARMTSSG